MMNHFVRQMLKRFHAWTASGGSSRTLHSSTSGIEGLEHRTMLQAAGFVGNAAHLTLSFAPDGTEVAGQESSLFALFDSVAETAEWQDAILDGFQTWAVNTNADIGVVPDQGLPLGTPGPARRDDRFGDVRVAAAPLAPDVLAISVPEKTVVSGSWVGDVIFNSDATFRSVDEIFSVALHEAGHVFGLDHSPDPASPMHIHGISPAITPTTDDLAALQGLFGQRVHDVNESPSVDSRSVSRNDHLQHATPLQPVADNDGLPGSAPAIAISDLTDQNDRDYFELVIPDNYTGPITVRLRTRGISLLDARVTIVDGEGNPLAIDRTSKPLAMDDLQMTVPAISSDQSPLYVRIDAAQQGHVRAVGGYALVVTWDDRLTVEVDNIDAVTNPDYRSVSAERLKSLFETSRDPLRNYDHFSNDQFDVATELTPVKGYPEGQRYEAYGEISSLEDVDIFSFQSPSRYMGTLIVSLRSRDPNRLIPNLYVYDERHEWRPATTLVNGGGQIVVQIDDYEPLQEYLVAVSAAEQLSQAAVPGTYQLAVDFGGTSLDLAEFSGGTLRAGAPRSAQFLHVAQPQLFHFIVESKTNTERPQAFSLTVSSTPLQLLVRAGESRSGASVLLKPGIYTIDVRMETQLAPEEMVQYELNGVVVSDTFGVIPIDPVDQPDFRCDDTVELYCFPNQVVTASPFTFESFVPFDWNGSSIFDVGETSEDWWNWATTDQAGAPPLPRGDSYEARAGSTLEVPASTGLLQNDVDPDDDLLATTLVQDPQHGVIELDPDGGFRYSPNAGFKGQDSFTYLAIDSTGRAVSALAMITVSEASGDLPGDASGDGVFDSKDLVLVFQAGQYEDRLLANSVWETGDWNGDGEFDSSDLVLAFQAGGYQNNGS